jgi:glycosyltransferase involved in cell wall biosynthesis
MGDNPAYTRRLRQSDVEVVELPLAGKQDLYSIWRLASVLRSGGFSVMHTHCRNGDFAGLVAAAPAGRGPRRIVTIHGLLTAAGGPPRSVNERIHGMLLRHLAERVIAVSGFVRDHLQTDFSIPPEKIELVYNGTDAAEDGLESCAIPAGLADGGPCVFSYGALTPQKDFETLIQAAPFIVQQVPGARFVICGEGPTEGPLQAMISGLGLDDHFHFLGHRSDIPILLRTVASVVVSTAHNEGFGRVATEAMAAGKPVVVAESGAFPELIQQGQNGYLFRPGHARELAMRVSQLLTNSSHAQAVGRAARVCYEQRFQVSHFLKKTIALLEQWADRNNA